MDELPPMPATPPPSPPPTSLAARLLNVFATPGDVFEEVKTSPVKHTNWLVPALLAVVLGVGAVWVLLSDPVFVQHQRETLAHSYDGMVKAGKMSQAEADNGVAMLEKFARPMGIVCAAAVGFVRIFWWALVLWLIALLFLKVKISYIKALEVAGLATMIGLLGDLVTFLLTSSLGKETSPSLAMAVTDFNPKNPLHLAFAAANVFSFWIIGVMSVGLARLAGMPAARVMFWVVLYWFSLQFLVISLATAARALTGG